MRTFINALLLGSLVGCSVLSTPVLGDVYLHNPRGSNNRNCGEGENRENNNRLFDSENNAKGGYACPRAHPFDCYKYEDNSQEKKDCNDENTSDAGGNMIDRSTGELKNPLAIATPRMYYYSNSILPIEWTNQHGGGANSKVHSDIVIQVACEQTLTDDCGDETGGETCGPRDGTPVNNDDTATTTIGEEPEEQLDYRRGRHETLRYYQKCDNRERNKGLFAADQKINGLSAMYTRQDNNAGRDGLECKEEGQYWPYFHDSPWLDVAVVTSDMERCLANSAASQNTVVRHECVCEDCTGRGQLPNNERHCLEKEGEWIEVPAHNVAFPGLENPECVEGLFSRDNHLGNVMGNGQTYAYNWTIPEYLVGSDSCVLRLRYNVSTGDFGDISVIGNSTQNGKLSPLHDRDDNEELSYYQPDIALGEPQVAFSLATNTNQYGRTFQDRSYTFSVKQVPEESRCSKIYNLNVRGKRGNIVQSYPSVEYDFVPSVLQVTQADCVHAQWTGSDYNPNRDGNNGEGGPPDPEDGAARTDRHNLVQMNHERENMPILNASDFTMFKIAESGQENLFERLMFIDQPIRDDNQCYTIQRLIEIEDDRDTREEHHKNCAKLSGAKTPYFDAGLLKPGEDGVYAYMSTRNNNFTNRSQKGLLIVGMATSKSQTTAITTSLSLVGLAAASMAAAFMFKRKSSKGGARQSNVGRVYAPPAVNTKQAAGQAGFQYSQAASGSPSAVGRVGGMANTAIPVVAATMAPTVPRHSQAVTNDIRRSGTPSVTALYDHQATEAGELDFRQGDSIEVLGKDPSGWWTGRLVRTGEEGIFPSNFVQMDG